MKIGDVIERVIMPDSPTARGGKSTYGPKWFFRLWRATVTEVDMGDRVEYDVHDTVVLMPDDPRVVAFLAEHYTPDKRLMATQNDDATRRVER